LYEGSVVLQMITSITIPQDVADQLGVAPLAFRGLAQVVILAGPNGAGKSRYLQGIERTMGRLRTARGDAANVQRNVKSRSEALDRARKRAAQLDSLPLPPTSDERLRRREEQVKGAHEHLRKSEAALAEAISASHQNETIRAFAQFSNLDCSSIEPHHDLTNIVSLKYTGDDDKMFDANDLSPAQSRAAVQQVQTGGFGNAHSGMHAYLASIARVLWSAEHPAEQKRAGFAETLSDARQFDHILFALLSTRLEYRSGDDGLVEPLIRGRPFRKQELSNGEKVLLTWAITLHKQKLALQNAIVTLDEPENYLHPDACIQALERLRPLLGEHGQIWIATHSVPLIAYGGLESVYLVKEGRAVFARNKVDEVVCSLLGGPQGRDRLQSMLREADEIAACRFLAECLVPSHAIDTPEGDPQESMLRELLAQAATAGKPLRMLDYGAGRGRLATAIGESNPTAQKIEYYAFDLPNPNESSDREACLLRIAALNQSRPREHYYWDSVVSLVAAVGRTFDIVVLCNVLHEIAPLEWLTTVKQIDKVLSDPGVVLIMEDLFPSIGEMPHAGGYLILDVFGLKKLFDGTDGVRLVAQARNARLSAVEVSKTALPRATAESRVSALKHALQRAKEEAERIRKDGGPRTADTGRRHAHHMVQIANAVLILEQLE
jgi:predicted ATPase